jgi:hypothetical protein
VFILFKSNGEAMAKITDGTKQNAAAINSNFIAEILFFCMFYLIASIRKNLAELPNKMLINKLIFYS